MALEPRTLFFVLAAGNAIIATAMFIANARGVRLRSMNLWAISGVCACIAWELYTLRGSIAYSISVIGGFAAITAAYAFEVAAVLDFLRERVQWAIIGLLWALSVAGIASDFFAYSGEGRMLVVSASMGVGIWELAPAVALFMLAPRGQRAICFMTGAFLALAAAGALYRAFDTIVSAHPTLALLDVNATQSLAFGASYVSMMGASLGFIIMTKERADLELAQAARRDGLTGLLNRVAFDERLRLEIARSARANDAVALLMFDLDHFKKINDIYGHLAGDAVLRSFAEILRLHVRSFDAVARYGGEEFCVLVAGGLERARAIGERIRIAATMDPIYFDRHDIRYSVSGGIACALASTADANQLMSDADRALYDAKAAGRNCVIVAHPSTGKEASPVS